MSVLDGVKLRFFSFKGLMSSRYSTAISNLTSAIMISTLIGIYIAIIVYGFVKSPFVCTPTGSGKITEFIEEYCWQSSHFLHFPNVFSRETCLKKGLVGMMITYKIFPSVLLIYLSSFIFVRLFYASLSKDMNVKTDIILKELVAGNIQTAKDIFICLAPQEKGKPRFSENSLYIAEFMLSLGHILSATSWIMAYQCAMNTIFYKNAKGEKILFPLAGWFEVPILNIPGSKDNAAVCLFTMSSIYEGITLFIQGLSIACAVMSLFSMVYHIVQYIKFKEEGKRLNISYNEVLLIRHLKNNIGHVLTDKLTRDFSVLESAEEETPPDVVKGAEKDYIVEILRRNYLG